MNKVGSDLSPNIDEINKLLCKTGWQSWSDIESIIPFKLPRHDFPPQEYIPNVLPFETIKLKKSAKGWCSWPNFGLAITESKILDQVNWLKNHPEINLDYILLDDGWTKWGDWLDVDKEKFPNGLKNLVAKIKENGMKAGIWIAPFLVHTDSQLFKDHSDWFVYKDSELVDGLNVAGINKFPIKRYLLDVTNLEVQEYLDRVFDFLFNKIGFELVKLDFLYGIYFNPVLSMNDADKYLHSFLLNLKNKYPHVYTIGCGCPLAPAFGVVDSMRIAKDNSISMGIPSPLFFIKELINRFYASVLYIPALLRNYKQREWTRKYWNLDLDTFICDVMHGFKYDDLGVMQRLIKESGGNLFFGDDFTILSKEKIDKYILPLLRNN